MYEIEKVELTEFALRHWEKGFSGTRITNKTPEEFTNILNSELKLLLEIDILNGYADFCKLIVVNNLTNARTGTLPITLENYRYLRSGYHSRRESELPVLSRWFDLPLPAPIAKYLVIVVYSREQLLKEWRSIIEKEKPDYTINDIDFPIKADWGIVAILAQMGAEEEPMKPATMLRNALGIEEGGSGIPIDRDKYLNSVEFWKTHATVKS